MAAGGRTKPTAALKARPDDRARGASQPAALEYRPLAPRRRLLVVLSILFAAWMVFLIVLYFTTIAPRRPMAPDDSLSAAPANPDKPAASGFAT